MTDSKQVKGLLYNWLSLIGIMMASVGFVAGAMLLVMDYTNKSTTAYTGIFTYLVVPAVLSLGLLFILIGVVRERRRRRLHGEAGIKPFPVIDLNNRKQYIAVITVVVTTFIFITLSGLGSYRAYVYTEDVDFCGATCHTPMKPEYTAYKQSPHANVRCVDCHIGPGAGSFIKAKLNGLHQVYAVALNNYKRPIETPIPNLRPADETCYECHWPAKFFGVLDRTWTYYGTDASNTPYTISLLLKVGGADPSRGEPHGIHWHVSANKVEYIAKDPKRETIPWIRVTDTNGHVRIYQTTEKSEKLAETNIAAATPRIMDCIDCHTRPAHRYLSPNRALDTALAQKFLDPAIPSIKKNAAKALLGKYETEEQALAEIEKQLRAEYPAGGPNIDKAVEAVKTIYSRNFFPEMKVSWNKYPDHIGHMITPGCFRCHDGKHKSEDGRVISMKCDDCHAVTAQGPGSKLTGYNREGLEFKHPGSDEGDDSWKEDRCDSCHTGAPDL